MKTTSISRRVGWLNVLVSGTALVITAVALLIFDQSSYRQILVENVSAQADVVGRNSISALIFNDPETAENTLSALETVPNIRAASLFAADHALFASYVRLGEPSITAMPPEIDLQAGSDFQGSSLYVTRPLKSNDRVVGYLVIKADTSGIQSRLFRYVGTVGIVLLLSLVGAIVMSLTFRGAVVQPIVELAKTAKLVSTERDYSVRVPPPTTGDEVAVLVGAFNEMLSGIQNRDLALDSERARLRAILDNAPVGILVVNTATRDMMIANKKMNELLRESVAESGKSYVAWQLFRPDRSTVPDDERPLARAMRGETVVGEEYIVVRHDGSEVWVRTSSAPVREKHGAISAGLLVVVDIDDQKKAQQALMQSEKLAAAGRLAASISHEINNPLESVVNLLFIAISDPSLQPHHRALLTQADQELARISHIATQTLRFYRQTTNPTSVEMGNVIDSVLQLLAGKLRNSNIEVERRYRARQSITCFEGEMRQVFANLISNAVDAIAARGGRITVATRELGSKGIQVLIADNGHGISGELKHRIFEPFYTTKGNLGTGLGLWVTKEIVEKHRGSVRVRSKVNGGTVFAVFIPFDGTTGAAPTTPQEKSASALGPL